MLARVSAAKPPSVSETMVQASPSSSVVSRTPTTPLLISAPMIGMVNPFALPIMTFTLPGISAAALSKQLEQLRSPHVNQTGLSISPLPLVSGDSDMQITSFDPMVSVKRNAMVVDYMMGKKPRAEGGMQLQPFESDVGFAPELSLPHSAGILLIFLPRRRI